MANFDRNVGAASFGDDPAARDVFSPALPPSVPILVRPIVEAVAEGVPREPEETGFARGRSELGIGGLSLAPDAGG